MLRGDPEKKWPESRKPEVQPAPSRSLATELPPELRYECPQIWPMITPQNSNEFDTPKMAPYWYPAVSFPSCWWLKIRQTHSPVGLWEVIYHYLPGFKKGSQVVGLGISEASTVGPLLLNSTGKSFRTLSNFTSLSLQSWSYCGMPLLNYHLMILDVCPKIKSDPKAMIS